MERERQGSPSSEAVPATPGLQDAADLARAMNILPWADTRIPPERLLEDEPRYRALASATGQILWLAAGDGTGIAGMRDWRAFTGQSVEEATGWGWFAAIHPDDHQQILALWQRSVGTGEVFEAEQRIRRFDGVYRHFTVRVVPVLDENGAVREWAGACTDVTERKEVAEALRASEARRRAVQEVTDTALAHLTLDELLPQLLERVRQALRADNAVILLLDDERRLRVRATAGLQAHLDTRVAVPLGRGVAGSIAATGKPLIVSDLSEVEVMIPVFQQFLTSLVGVPLLAPDGVRGVLHVATAAQREFTDDDVRLLELVAERMVVAIERAQFYEAERAARETASERALQLEAIIESMADAVFVCDHHGDVMSYNRAAERLGLPAEDEPVREVIHEVMRRVLAGETLTGSRAVEITLSRWDKEAVELSLSGSPVWDRAHSEEAHPMGGVFIFHDVTERRAIERKTTDALRSMLAMAERLVAEDDPDGGPRANQTGQRLVEGAATALGSQRVALVAWDEETDLLTSIATTGFTARASDPTWRFPDGQARLSDFLDAARVTQLRADHPLVLDTSIIPPEVERGAGDLLLVPTRIRDRLMGLMVVDSRRPYGQDEITLARAIARLAALMLERDRLDREREEARASAKALKAANERLDAFLSMAGHELRTPLTMIKGFIQVAERLLRPDAERVASLTERLDADQLACLDTLLEYARQPLALADTASDLLNRLVGDILNAEAIRLGKLKTRLESCDLAAITRATVAGLQLSHPEREITLDVAEDASIPIIADALRIMQALTNYLTNALKYAPADQPIVVTIAAPAPRDDIGAGPMARPMAHVTVRDAGPGLPVSEHESVWGRFARAEAVERRTGGLGLGLFITRAIIEQHGGRTWVESAPGAGCAFSFTLPLAAESGALPKGGA
jgi:PAS domain S-box-containing protein